MTTDTKPNEASAEPMAATDGTTRQRGWWTRNILPVSLTAGTLLIAGGMKAKHLVDDYNLTAERRVVLKEKEQRRDNLSKDLPEKKLGLPWMLHWAKKDQKPYYWVVEGYDAFRVSRLVDDVFATWESDEHKKEALAAINVVLEQCGVAKLEESSLNDIARFKSLLTERIQMAYKDLPDPVVEFLEDAQTFEKVVLSDGNTLKTHKGYQNDSLAAFLPEMVTRYFRTHKAFYADLKKGETPAEDEPSLAPILKAINDKDFMLAIKLFDNSKRSVLEKPKPQFEKDWLGDFDLAEKWDQSYEQCRLALKAVYQTKTHTQLKADTEGVFKELQENLKLFDDTLPILITLQQDKYKQELQHYVEAKKREDAAKERGEKIVVNPRFDEGLVEPSTSNIDQMKAFLDKGGFAGQLKALKACVASYKNVPEGSTIKDEKNKFDDTIRMLRAMIRFVKDNMDIVFADEKVLEMTPEKCAHIASIDLEAGEMVDAIETYTLPKFVAPAVAGAGSVRKVSLSK